MVPRLQNQVQRVARVVEKTFNLRYLGQYDWGLFEARAYDEKVNPLFMDFGPDTRFWYGPGALPAGSGGDNAVDMFPDGPEPARGTAPWSDARPHQKQQHRRERRGGGQSRRAEPGPRRRSLSER
jgi:hypothetical protein